MCLDQKLQKIEREHKTWLRSRELEASTTSKNLREPSILIEFKKSNEYYMAFINSRCRRIFFENQYKGNEADLLRLCKIDEITRRIEQLKSDSKYN